MLGRRILKEIEKQSVLERWHYQCYICQGDIINPEEAEFVHISPLDQGGTFALDNLAPVHDYCFLKGKDQDLEYARDDALINTAFSTDFDNIFEARRAEPTISVDTERMMAMLDDEPVRLYQCPNTGILYFYHQVPAAYLEADPLLAPRGLERQRVVSLLGHLRTHPQLYPVVCRLEQGHLRVVSGLHRAAAQYLGNRNARIDCKVLVDADPILLGQAEQASRRRLRTRARKPAPLTTWLLQEYRPQITAWQEVHPDRELTEAEILLQVLELKEPAATRLLAGFLEAWLQNTAYWQQLTSRCKEVAVLIPESMPQQLIQALMQTRPAEAVLESEEDVRLEEGANMQDMLEMLWQDGLFPGSENKSFSPALAQTQLREEGVELWAQILADAVRIILQRRPDQGICYGALFTPLEKVRIRRVVQNLFRHPFWQDLDLDRALRQVDRTYLNKARKKWGLDHLNMLRG